MLFMVVVPEIVVAIARNTEKLPSLVVQPTMGQA